MNKYTSGIPRPSDIPAVNQPVIQSNFSVLNETMNYDHFGFGTSIQGASTGNPCFITIPGHGLQTGDSVTVDDMEGIDELGIVAPWDINGNSYDITVVDQNTFFLGGADTTDFDPYVENSGVLESDDIPVGKHKQITFNKPLSNIPAISGGSLFTSDADVFLNFLKSNGRSYQLTGLTPDEVTAAGSG